MGTEQMSALPPSPDRQRVALELRFVPRALKTDALQEAWLAHLSGRSPAQAIKTFAERERRHRRRFVGEPNLN